MANKQNIFFNNILALFLILLSGSILFMAYVIPTFIAGFCLALLSISTIYKGIGKHFWLFYKSLLIVITFLSLNFIFSPSNSFGNYITVIMLSLYAFLVKLSFDIRKQDFTKTLYKVLNFFVVYSLLGFVFSQFLPLNIVEIGPTGYRTGTFKYLFYYLSDVNILGVDFFRNQGFFWEPGVMSVFANIFLFFSLFKYKNSKNILLGVICIVSTFSTTGLLLMVLQLIYSLKTYKLGKSKKFFLLLLVVPLFFIGYSSFSEKKEESDIKNITSYGVRLYDLYSGYKIAINNPIFGVGLNKKAYLKERDKHLPEFMSFNVYDIGDRATSNDFVKIFFSLGIFFGIYIIYLMYNQTLVDENRLLFLIVILINLSTEPLLYTPFFLFLIFTGLQTKLK